MKTEFSSLPLTWTSWWHVQTSNKMFMAPSIPRAPINTHPLPHPPPQEFSRHLGFLFFINNCNPMVGSAHTFKSLVWGFWKSAKLSGKTEVLNLVQSWSWSLYLIICHVELWFRKCKLNSGHNKQAYMYQLKFTYRIYSNNRPTSNKRTPQISAHPKGRKS